jgi:beta-galactosidase
MDVQGFNYYHNGDMDAYHQRNPAKPCIGTEEASAFYTRGIYDNTKTYRSAYDDNKPGYGTTAEEWVNFFSARQWASGAFVWTGFDYRGEASPFHWPNISSEFGILDTCGFPKDVFYYYQSCWTDKPVLHLMPHWNWPGKETQDINVDAFSNCQEVELFLNGQSLGRKAMPRNSHWQWNVKYAPGTLSAKGYDHGRAIAETKVETTGAPARIQLTPDRATIHADGEDCSVVTVTVTDAQGRLDPVADNLIHFEVAGVGKIIGVGNGSPICHEPDVYLDEHPVRTVALGGWRIGKVQDASKKLPETAADFDDSGWKSADVRAESGPLHEGESAVYRTHVSITSKEIAAQRVSINIGRIDDDGWVYVNGRRAGESHDWEQDPTFEVGPLLHAGDNTIAVAVQNGDGDGGLNKGATLEFDGKSDGAHWQRSVFNGLAQVIVKAGTNSGEIQVRAMADGLASAVTVIHAEPYPARPTLP